MVEVQRVQTGVRIERRLLKVLKALAEYLDVSLGDLLEGIVLHVFEQRLPFDEATARTIDALKRVYGLDLKAADSHQLHEPQDLTEGKADDDDLLQTRPPRGQGAGRPPSRTSPEDVHPER
ncbi:MAG TPA: hypothetical protein VME46_17685 [Acidimicrobiales bacterium]|nr:hypothetical protein [Acidimicrobiales bacterium]